MPPITSILDRERRRAAMLADVPQLLDTSREMVDEGTGLLARLSAEANRPAHPASHHGASLLLLRHLLEQADSIDVQLREGVVSPTRLQTRAILDALMQLHYLFGIRRDFEPSPVESGLDAVPRGESGLPLTGEPLASVKRRRGSAYLMAAIRGHLRTAELYLVPNYEDWLSRRAGVTDMVPEIVDAENQEELARDIARLRADLSSPANEETNRAFEECKAGNNRQNRRLRYEPAWYSLWNGPMSVRELASAVGFAAVYDLSYSPGSEVMHGTDVLGQFAERNPALGTAPLRHRYGAKETIQRYLMYVLHAYKVMIDEIRPTDVALWAEWNTRWLPVIMGLH